MNTDLQVLALTPNPVPQLPKGVGQGQLPVSVDELSNLVVRSYDLNVKSALELNIPVCSIEGGSERRVVVYEWAAYKDIEGDFDVHYQYGYVIRFCLTISKWDANAKTSLGFIAASVELGQAQAQWVMEVRGLSGPNIDKAIIPPTELKIETLIKAKDSLEALVTCIRDGSTRFYPYLISQKTADRPATARYLQAAATVHALAGIEKGWTLGKAREEFGTQEEHALSVIDQVYRELGGIDHPQSKPKKTKSNEAADLLKPLNLKKWL